MRHERFDLHTLDELKEKLERLGVELPLSTDTDILAEPLELPGGKRLPNRFAALPMEGFDAAENGEPSYLSFRRYARYARGGYALIWCEATAVVPEGRSNPHQFWINEENVDTYRRLVERMREAARETHGHEVTIVLQLTHSGRYSKPSGVPEPIIAHHSAVLDRLHSLPPDYPLVSDEYLDRLQEEYVKAARLAARAGFDGVDVKACHRYLVSELLASFTRKDSKYGGCFENRVRFLLETIDRIRSEVKDVFVTTRLNVYDAIEYPYGFGVDAEDPARPDLSEPMRLVEMLRERGIPVLNVSIGNPYFTPHYGRPYDFPIKNMQPPDEHPLEGVARFQQIASQIQQAFPDLPLVTGAMSWLRHLLPYAAAGMLKEGKASMVGLGRSSFAYPDAPADIMAKGTMDPNKTCISCSACTQIMRDGGRTGCVVRDRGIYAVEYRRARRMAPDRLKEEAARCRNCTYPSCATGCAAEIDIPGFIKAFLEDDIERSYRIIREKNVLPELCGMACPAEETCEKNCVEEAFCENAVAIKDIQLFVCRTARRKGITAVEIPSGSPRARVAVVGAGPAGIAAAAVLLEGGCAVDMFEATDKPGGTPMLQIPPFRLDTKAAATEVEALLGPALEAGRLKWHMNTQVGSDVPLQRLIEEYDGVIVAVGLAPAARIRPGTPGVMTAAEFLSAFKSGKLENVPDRVAVIGGGNTAMDAASTALAAGARDVYLVYRRSLKEMPAWRSELEAFLDGGGHLLCLSQPRGYVFDEGGTLTGLRIERTILGEPDESGRRRPVALPDSESVLPVDLVIEATGQKLAEETAESLKAAGIRLDERGLVAVDGEFRTHLPRVFAAGDAVNGGTTIVQAVAEGMKAADALLRDVGCG